jgi:lysophospholipase L1-like esterase
MIAVLPGALPAAEPFALHDGDRVVFLGNALIEREQRYGYWETLLTILHPDKNITFRNLGWSGDTVFGHARAGFGSTADGFKHLKEHVLSLKPTVIVIGYGANEAFDGTGGLPTFEKGLTLLLDTLRPTKARLVIVSPLRQEDLGRPLPDPTEQNRNLHLYTQILRKVAAERGHIFVDLYHWSGKEIETPLTDNGIHLTAFGYWRAAQALLSGLGFESPAWRIEINSQGRATTKGVRVNIKPSAPLGFQVDDAVLPVPAPPGASSNSKPSPASERVLLVRGLSTGKHALMIDDKEVIVATAEEWAAGVTLARGPDFDHVEQLRQTIIDKNRLYFHRWRPQNETYLFGFRKHEQGQNAREIPQFDPLVAKLEADIARLRRPIPHQYEIVKRP